METKQCTKCKEFKEANQANYSPRADGKGWPSWCKVCCRSLSKNRPKRVRNSAEDKAKHAEHVERYKKGLLDGTITRPASKVCNKCKANLPQEMFQFINTRDGLYSTCKPCKAVMMAKKYAKTKDDPVRKNIRATKTKGYRDTKKVNLWWDVLYHTAKFNTAPSRSLTFDLPDPQFILDLWGIQKGLCYWFGIPMVPSSLNHSPSQPSLERLDCNKGYVVGNVVLACHAANRGRGNQTQEVWAKFCDEMRAHLGR